MFKNVHYTDASVFDLPNPLHALEMHSGWIF
jgi:hypothetical protein